MLVLDAWLLSHFTGVRKWLQEKGPRILWITLLPLLLLFGEFYIFLFKKFKFKKKIEKNISPDSTFSHRSTSYLNQSVKHSQTSMSFAGQQHQKGAQTYPGLHLLFVSGTYIAQKHFFTCVDSLRSVQYGVTETTYHIFNYIIDLTSFYYELFIRYFAESKNYFMHLLPSVNVSLPEMPPIGWNIKW